METYLKESAERLKINLNNDQISKFISYKNLLQEWNERINLTTIIEDKDIIIKHFIDSLTCLKYIKETDKLIDVGTGAGFPGLPVKIVKNEIKLTLLDSLNKRLLFLEDVITKNTVENVELLHGRAEDYGKNINYREKYDVAVARAVSNTATLSELCLPFVKKDGIFICMKGNQTDEVKEGFKAIELMGGKLEEVEQIVLPGTDIERNIYIIRKIKETPTNYPRKAGVPEKNPIK